MTFERVWVLWFLLLPAAWIAWEWTRQARRAPMLLKAAMAACVILALSAPSFTWRDQKVALALLVDTSASVSDNDLKRENQLLNQIDRARGSNLLQIIPFARTPRTLDPAEAEGKLNRTSGAPGRATNLEAPIRQALASLPAGMLHRIALLSDGNENEGAVTRVAWQAQQAGIHIDTIALAGREQPKLKTEAVGIPGTVFTGERFPVDITVVSPKATAAVVELSAEGKSLGQHRVALEAGENRVRIRTSLNAAGAVDLSGRIEAPGLGESRFENAIAVRQPKVVWVSEDPPGTEEHIAQVLNANRFELVQTKTLPANLEDTQMVVFNNINLDALRPGDKQRTEDFVLGGGGALVIAGDHTVYVDHKDAP